MLKNLKLKKIIFLKKLKSENLKFKKLYSLNSSSLQSNYHYIFRLLSLTLLHFTVQCCTLLSSQITLVTLIIYYTLEFILKIALITNQILFKIIISL